MPHSCTVNQLPKIDPTLLEDDDLLIIWDKSAQQDRNQIMAEVLRDDSRELPKTTKCIRLGDLKAFLRKE